jgi:peptide/nickel transport system substrate-binding protein
MNTFTSKTKRLSAVVAVVTVAALAACTASPNAPDNDFGPLVTTTEPGVADAGNVVWGLYRATNSLDPIFALDIPENSIIDTLCEGLMTQKPDLSVAFGLAEAAEYVTPTQLVFTLRDGVTFWDGAPLTADDAVFSIQRAADAAGGSFYAPALDRIESVTASGPLEVTIDLSRPDYSLLGELSAMPGMVIQKAYAEDKGQDYGTSGGGVMCTGPYTLTSWTPGADIVVERNADYWDSDNLPLSSQITFRPVSGDAAMTNGLITGEVDGTYAPAISTAEQLRESSAVSSAMGPSLLTDAISVVNMDGALATVEARQALSLALDRDSYVALAYHGAADVPSTIANPGAWAAAPEIYEAAASDLPVLTQDLDRAKELAEEAGIAGEPLVIAAMQGDLQTTTANMILTAAREIGLEPTIKTYSPDEFFLLFIDPSTREGIDVLPTLNNPDVADPGLFLGSIALPTGALNYNGFDDPEVTELLNRARETADADERATLVTQAEALLLEQLPWIPLANINSVVYQNTRITGAVASFAFEQGPWANQIGLTG